MFFFDKLFRRGMEANVQLNARYNPDDREAYAELLARQMKKLGLGGPGEGGGTMVSRDGEPLECDFDILIKPGREAEVCKLLDGAFFVPKGSKLLIGDAATPIGRQEGLALRLGAELLTASGVESEIAALEACLEGVGRYLSAWPHENGVTMYFYGPAYSIMQEKLAAELLKHPLMAGATMEQIA